MKRLFLAMMLVVPVNLGAQESPTLAVMIVVDQLRGDLLEHYGPAFTGGFRRLLDEGFHFTQIGRASCRERV